MTPGEFFPSHKRVLRSSISFPGGSVVKNLIDNIGNKGLIPELGRSPGGKKWQSTSVFLSGKYHGQRSLVGYSPCGCKSQILLSN